MDFDSTLSNFKENLDSVSKLVNFDKEVQEIAINGIENLHHFLKDEKGFANPKWNGERTLQTLRNIRKSPMLEDRYSLIFNQAVVLMVSYFASGLGDLFRASIARSFKRKDDAILRAELKVQVEDIALLLESVDTQLGEFIIRKEGLSFQDMQSTHRAFKEYFGINIQTDENVRNIIVAQACRHSIVHVGARVDLRMINQLKTITPRPLKPDIKLNDKITFTLNEISEVENSMIMYLDNLVENLKAN